MGSCAGRRGPRCRAWRWARRGVGATDDELEPYLALVERYRHGAHEQAILSLSGYSQEAVETAFGAWQELVSDQTTGFDALANQRPDLARARHPRTLESAALLHAVTGMVAQDRGTAPGLQFHLGVARGFIRLRDTRRSKTVGRVREVVPPPSDEEAAARQNFDADWNLAVAVFFHGRWALEEAKPYMESAMMLPHVDANRLLDAGRLFEASHAARTMRLNHRYDPRSQSPSVLKQRMIDLAGANQSARMALARLLALSGRSEEASTLVAAILTTKRERRDEPWWLYHHPDEDTLSRIIAGLQERLQ